LISAPRQRTESVVTTDLSVKARDKSVWRTVFCWLEHKPNFMLRDNSAKFEPIYLELFKDDTGNAARKSSNSAKSLSLVAST
jgi:hypothetical protein